MMQKNGLNCMKLNANKSERIVFAKIANIESNNTKLLRVFDDEPLNQKPLIDYLTGKLKWYFQ